MKIRRKGWMGEWEEEIPEEIRAEVLGDETVPRLDLADVRLDPAKVKAARVEACRRAGRMGGRPRGSTKLQMVWDDALAALLKYPTLEQAADAIGVPWQTLQSWLKNPLFLEQVETMRRQSTAHACLAMQGNQGKIVQKIFDIIYDETQSASNRLTAAKLILDKISDLQQYERAESEAKARVERLEKVKDEIIAGRLGGEDLALPEAGEPDGDAGPGPGPGEDGEPEPEPEPAGYSVAEDDAAARGRTGETGGGTAAAGASGADE